MKIVNVSVPKVDGIELVTGSPAYTDDFLLNNALVVKILRSPHAFAKIKNIDIGKAMGLAGVECVLTYQDLPRKAFTRAGQSYPEPSPYDTFILDRYVRYVGDEVAIIAAVDEYTAEQAMKLIKVEYEILDPVLDFAEAEGHPSVIHPEPEAHTKFEVGFVPEKNVATTFEVEVGNVAEVLEKCDVVVSETYYTQAQAHVMMETHRSFSHLDYQGRLVITSSTQVPFHVRRILANALDLPISKIRVIKPRIGGGYGGKQTLHNEMFAAAVTLKTGKPAKVVYSRKEAFEATTTRHPMRLTVTVGADAAGKIKAIDIQGLSDTGAYGDHAPTVFWVCGQKALPMYNKVEAARYQGKAVYTNNTPSGALRGYGATQGNFALESAINELAEKLGMDPVKLRQKNMIANGEVLGTFTPGVDDSENILDSCALDYCVQRGMELIGWQDKYPNQELETNKVRGVGMAVTLQGSGIAGIDMGSATIKLNEEGFFNLLVGATDMGTGSDTILAQIAAETLGVELKDIVVYSADTDVTPFDGGAYASSATYVTGNAVKRAAEQMKKLIEAEGARYFNSNIPSGDGVGNEGGSSSDVIIEVDQVEFDGRAIVKKDGTGGISLDELSTILLYSQNQQQLVATGSFAGHKSPPPFLAGFAEVEVDLETGKVELVEFVAVVDAGTTINPNLARIQVEGGLVQGIGMAMFEEVKRNSRGKLITNSLLSYKVPTRKDIGKLTVEFADSYEPTGPYGAKSVGEICHNTPLAAIADAVYNATGVRVRSLPITPEKVMMGLLK